MSQWWMEDVENIYIYIYMLIVEFNGSIHCPRLRYVMPGGEIKTKTAFRRRHQAENEMGLLHEN